MNDFVRLTDMLYADSPYYVPDLEMDTRDAFNPAKIWDWSILSFNRL